jgi:hypothetical protein
MTFHRRVNRPRRTLCFLFHFIIGAHGAASDMCACVHVLNVLCVYLSLYICVNVCGAQRGGRRENFETTAQNSFVNDGEIMKLRISASTPMIPLLSFSPLSPCICSHAESRIFNYINGALKGMILHSTGQIRSAPGTFKV